VRTEPLEDYADIKENMKYVPVLSKACFFQ